MSEKGDVLRSESSHICGNNSAGYRSCFKIQHVPYHTHIRVLIEKSVQSRIQLTRSLQSLQVQFMNRSLVPVLTDSLPFPSPLFLYLSPNSLDHQVSTTNASA